MKTKTLKSDKISFKDGLEIVKKIQAIKSGECKDWEHDYDNYIRKGRAWLVCPKCGKDITIDLVLMADAKKEKE